ncbi:MAG: GTPase [Flavobacteriaceae bacterium]
MVNNRQQKLIFVYNADSGLLNAVLDSAHKVLSPSTYACHLCDITYGFVSENNIWKKFKTEHGTQWQFLHKDEFNNKFASKFGHKFTFPIILIEGDSELEVVIGTEELNNLPTTESLIELLAKRAER